jgi:hypothetical protein
MSDSVGWKSKRNFALRCSVKDNGGRVSTRTLACGPAERPVVRPFPSPQCRCDRKRARTVYTPQASAVQAIVRSVIPSKPLNRRSRVAYTLPRENDNRGETQPDSRNLYGVHSLLQNEYRQNDGEQRKQVQREQLQICPANRLSGD